MEYPEEIYATRDGGMLTDHYMITGAGWGRRHAYNIGCARGYQSGYQSGYEAGKAEQADPLEGYSNLTEAISAGEPIDWEELDGLKTQCVKPGVGTLRGTLERNESRPADNPAGWWRKGADSLYVSAFIYGWTEHYGWTLWIEGEIPLRRKTADQLEVGTEFYGVLKTSEPDGVAPELMLRTQGHVLHLDDYTISQKSPRNFEVVKVVGVYGTFQKPEGK